MIPDANLEIPNLKQKQLYNQLGMSLSIFIKQCIIYKRIFLQLWQEFESKMKPKNALKKRSKSRIF